MPGRRIRSIYFLRDIRAENPEPDRWCPGKMLTARQEEPPAGYYYILQCRMAAEPALYPEPAASPAPAGCAAESYDLHRISDVNRRRLRRLGNIVGIVRGRLRNLRGHSISSPVINRRAALPAARHSYHTAGPQEFAAHLYHTLAAPEAFLRHQPDIV